VRNSTMAWCLVLAVCTVTGPVRLAIAGNQLDVEITGPDEYSTLRGPTNEIGVTVTPAGMAIDWVALYHGVYQKSSIGWDPGEGPTWQFQWDANACTFGCTNGAITLKAKAEDDGDGEDHDFRDFAVDNAYLIRVNRNSDILWKYWTGNGWASSYVWCLDEEHHAQTPTPAWGCLTTGGGVDTHPQWYEGHTVSGYCQGPDAEEWYMWFCKYHGCPPDGHGGSTHHYCTNGDTPGYTGSERNYPLVGTPQIWGEEDCDASWGWARIPLPASTACCGCYRQGIYIHGDGGGVGDCEEEQDLVKTLGCIRMCNGHVEKLAGIVAAAKARGADVHICVPAGTWEDD